MSRIPQETRHKIIALAEIGQSRQDIASRVGCDVKTVARIVHAFRNEGRIHDALHARRPSSTTPDEDHWIIAAVVDKPTITIKEMQQELGLRVSEKTIRRRLRQAGLRSRVARQKPFLTYRHKQLRLEFAREHSTWTLDHWKMVAFTDECTFCTVWDQQRHVWRPDFRR